MGVGVRWWRTTVLDDIVWVFQVPDVDDKAASYLASAAPYHVIVTRQDHCWIREWPVEVLRLLLQVEVGSRRKHADDCP